MRGETLPVMAMNQKDRFPRHNLPMLGAVALGSILVGLAALSGERPTRSWTAAAPPRAAIQVPVRPVAYRPQAVTIKPSELLALTGRVAPQSTFRVQLSQVLREGRLQVSSASGLLVVDPATHKAIAQVPGNATYAVGMTADGRGLSGPTGKDLPARRVRIQPISPDTPMETGARSFLGALEVSLGAEGLDVLNEVAQEDYIAGVVAGEAARSFPLEALKAQAVAARTYAMSQRGNRGADIDVVDTVADQVYTGAGVAWPEVREAVNATAGEVLTHGGRPIVAYFSADCGGHTRTNMAAGLGKRALPYLQAVRDADENGRDYCAASPSHTWSRRVTKDEILPGLNERLGAEIEDLHAIRFSRVFSDGRVGEVTVQGLGALPPAPPAPKPRVAAAPPADEKNVPGGGVEADAEQPEAAPTEEAGAEEPPAREAPAPAAQKEHPPAPEVAAPPVRPEIQRALRAFDFRKAVGTDILRSQIMTVEPDGEGAWMFAGRGYGHGVGMCQWGAAGRANAGISYSQILLRYYTGVTLEQNAPRNGVLEGIAKYPDGVPFANARVTLLGTDREAIADARGRFRFDALPAATYDVVVTPGEGAAVVSFSWSVRPGETTAAVVKPV